MIALSIAFGGALGALSRWWVGGWIQRAASSGFPMGTLVVNVIGSFLLAFAVGLFEAVAVPPAWRSFLAVGFCGAFTTFSTFSFESVRLLQGGEWGRAGAYLFGSVVVSLSATVIGFWSASVLLARR